MTFRITLSNQTTYSMDATYLALLRRAVRTVFRQSVKGDAYGSSVGPFERQKFHIDIAIVDDRTSHRINVDFLGHDFPTDVISFALDDDGSTLEGELVVNIQYATRSAQEYGWPPAHELLLYVIHGSLHLVGYDDHTETDRDKMRLAERRVLESLRIPIPPTMPQSPEFRGPAPSTSDSH